MPRDPEAVADIATTIGLKVWPAFLERACCDKKEIWLNGGWRGGKSASAAFLLLVIIITELCLRPGKHLVWLVASDYKYTVPEFNYIMEWWVRLGWKNTITELSTPMQGGRHMVLTIPGMPGSVEIETKSADDPTSLGGRAPDVLLGCEAGLLSEEARFWILGRTAEKNATVIWSGTFENDEGKAQFAWFEEESEKAWTQPTPRQSAFRLPTWENLSLYASCLQMIAEDSSLSMWCPPETPHGDSHSGVNHPMIRRLQDQWKNKPKDWLKRFGGEPTGVRNPIYEWAIERPGFYLKPMPAELKTATFGRNSIWLYTAGGIDPGLVHPAALTVGSIVASGPYKGQTWVRGGVHDLSGSAQSMWNAKDFLAKRYGVSKWGGDPVGLQYTREYEDIEAMRGSLYSRMARVKIVNGVAQDEMLFFDSEDPYVRLLFAQIQRVHMRKDANGSLVYDRREDDDMVASFEGMMAMLHGQPILRVKKHYSLPVRTRREMVTPRSAS